MTSVLPHSSAVVRDWSGGLQRRCCQAFPCRRGHHHCIAVNMSHRDKEWTVLLFFYVTTVVYWAPCQTGWFAVAVNTVCFVAFRVRVAVFCIEYWISEFFVCGKCKICCSAMQESLCDKQRSSSCSVLNRADNCITRRTG